MKLDGVNMETTEPTEAVAEPLTQGNPSEQALPQDTANDTESHVLTSVSPLSKEGAKLDAVDTEATEPSEGVAQPSTTQENLSERAAPLPQDASVAPMVSPNGRPVAAVKPKYISKKPTGKSLAQPGTNSHAAAAASHWPANNVRVPGHVSAVRQTVANAKSAAAVAGVAPKRAVGGATASSSVRSQTRVPDKRPVAQARTTSAGNAAANTKRAGPEAVGGARPKTQASTSRPLASTSAKPVTSATQRPGAAVFPKTTSDEQRHPQPDKRPVAQARTTSASNAAANTKRAGPEAVGGARPKTQATTSRPSASTAAKPVTSTTQRPGAAVFPKTTKPTTGSATSKPAPAASRPTTATSKPTVPRATTAPSGGRTTAALPAKTVAARKDVSRPPTAVAAKKSATSAAAAAAAVAVAVMEPEPTKPTTTTKSSNSKLSTVTKPAAPKVAQSKALPPPSRSTPTRPIDTVKFSATSSSLAPGRTPPASPAGQPGGRVTPQAKRDSKPTQAVSPFNTTRRTPKTTTPAARRSGASTSASLVVTAAAATTVAIAVAASLVAESPAETPMGSHDPPQEKVLLQEEALPQYQDSTPGPVVPSPSPSPPPLAAVQEQVNEPAVLLAAPQPEEPQQQQQNTPTLAVPFRNLNEEEQQQQQEKEEEEEEREEASQLVSVSEMSGTTQPTEEESRPGSAGGLGGGAVAWRAGSGAFLSELDSEEVSGSQQGASELSAPGVLEGTESTDDLGEGSFKGAADTEGASAGSPDLEKVPDIPANDFDEEEEEDEEEEDEEEEEEEEGDRVCDMDVGSERADEPRRRPRDDNQVDEEEDEEDEDVEMASEGVTESGLESYGNPDEDDFVDEERLDNLNRAAAQQQRAPPPPPQLPSALAAQWDRPNPFSDPWAEPALSQPEPNTPTQTGLQFPSGPPGAAESANLSPEEPKDNPTAAADGEAVFPPSEAEPDPQSQKGEGEGEGEGEEETLSADEAPCGRSSNTSTSSASEDELSDMEGEAQLDQDQLVVLAPDGQPAAQRCLSTVEEGEEAELEVLGGGGGDTPPSATSLASYGLDSAATASTSNAQSAESCVRSPGIFSLEELPEEPKGGATAPTPPPQLHVQHHIECSHGEDEEGGQKVAQTECRGDDDGGQLPYYSAICEKTENSFAGS